MNPVTVKSGLIGLFLLTGIGSIAERAAALGPSPALLAYAGLFGLLALVLVATAWIGNIWVRAGYGALLAAAAAFFGGYHAVTGDFLFYEAFLIMTGSAGSAGDALAQNWRPLALGILPALLLLAAILWPVRTPRVPQPLALAALPLATFALAGLFYLRGGDGGRGLPAPFPPLAYTLLAAYESAVQGHGPRQDVALVPRPAAADGRDIILIVDESVAGHYLDINRPDGVRSGLSAPPRGTAIHNFGLAAAISHCSLGTNITLRHGGTRDDYQRINAVMPSLWAYARRAGFAPVLVDAQISDGPAASATVRGELEGVELVQLPGIAVRDRDLAAAERVAALTRNGRADFVILNKVGAHFPVHDKYPDAFMRYRPALPRGRFLDVTDTGSRAGFGGTAEDWRRYRNAYRNSLLWNVGAFFDRLLVKADLSQATILYTSDHGQDLHEDGRPGYTTHCTADPAPSEGAVPLVVIEKEGAARLDWAAGLAANSGRASHYAVFPTLLALLGYDPATVEPLYGRSLVQPLDDPMTFNARFYARLGKEPLWVKLQPPALHPRSAAADGPQTPAQAHAGLSPPAR